MTKNYLFAMPIQWLIILGTLLFIFLVERIKKKVLSDLWVLDNVNWKKIKTTVQPEPRTFAPLVYDDANNRLVLFGGSKVLFGTSPESENLLNDTWEFSNNQWKKLTPENTPSPRAESSMVYDESRQTIVLFGGYDIQNGTYNKLGDTWEFSEGDWHLVSIKGPSERHGASMIYDIENKSVVLFGGSTIDKQYGEHKGETWKWNGEKWSKLGIEQPKRIFNATMTFDKRLRKIIRFGGWNGESRIDETWAFYKNEWEKLKIETRPSPRNHSASVYDEKEKRVILFGGHDGSNVFGDTWEFKNHNWKKISETDSIKRKNNGH